MREGKKIKKFIAIGHWDYSKNITCVVSDASSRKEFEHDLKGNGFIVWMVLSEKMLSEYKALEEYNRLFKIYREEARKA